MNVNDLFGLEFHMRNLDKGTDPLVRLDELVEWELFRPTLRTIRDKTRKSNAGGADDRRRAGKGENRTAQSGLQHRAIRDADGGARVKSDKR